MPETFADVLGHYVQRSRYSAPQVAALSGLSRRTIANWLGGIALKPQQWQGVVKVAVALKLNEAETSHLLAAAGHRPCQGHDRLGAAGGTRSRPRENHRLFPEAARP